MCSGALLLFKVQFYIVVNCNILQPYMIWLQNMVDSV